MERKQDERERKREREKMELGEKKWGAERRERRDDSELKKEGDAAAWLLLFFESPSPFLIPLS